MLQNFKREKKKGWGGQKRKKTLIQPDVTYSVSGSRKT